MIRAIPRRSGITRETRYLCARGRNRARSTRMHPAACQPGPGPLAVGRLARKPSDPSGLKTHDRHASDGGGAAVGGGLAIVLAITTLACLPAPAPHPQAAAPVRVHAAPAAASDADSDERYCAWYGESSAERVLYFGQAAFWSSYRAAGLDPRADLATAGPRRIGRFDLEARRFLEPIETGPRLDGSPARSGVWDVLPLVGRVWFTSYFEEAGFVDLDTGEVTLLPGSRFWNELALGPAVATRQGSSTRTRDWLLVSRYADASEGGGAVLVVDPDGRVAATLALRPRLEAPPGTSLAPKTPAWDPVAREIWVTTDRLPLPPADDENTPFAHPTLVLDLSGRELRRYGTPEDPVEVQFVRFDRRGLGYLAVARDGRLELLVLRPGERHERLDAMPAVVLDEHFASGLDFAQDIQLAPDGSALVTRWSGRVHQVTPTRGQVRSWVLPRDEDALYYTAVAGGADGSICATRCGDVEVVCASPAAAGTR